MHMEASIRRRPGHYIAGCVMGDTKWIGDASCLEEGGVRCLGSRLVSVYYNYMHACMHPSYMYMLLVVT